MTWLVLAGVLVLCVVLFGIHTSQNQRLGELAMAEAASREAVRQSLEHRQLVAQAALAVAVLMLAGLLGTVIRSDRRVAASLAAAHDSERRYRDLFESLPPMVWSCTPDGRFDQVNQRWMEYTGAGRDELLAYGWQNHAHPDDLPALAAAWKRSMDEQVPMRIDLRMRRHDGRYRWFDTRAVPLRDEAGETIRWAGTLTDIDDAVTARAALRDREETSRSMVSALSEGVIVFGADASIRDCNPSAERIM
ncbi:MAG: PAS domain-containing protein, partial [Ideonella sp.]|nr:PAS domain-containing protein [Ideonella sp.]